MKGPLFSPPLWGGGALVAALALHFLAVGAAASLPWLAAHLEFWGRWRGRKGDLEAAERLGEAAAYNVGAVFLFGMAALLLTSVQRAPAFFPAASLLAPVLLALLPLYAGYIGLLYLYRYGWRWSGRRPLLHVAAAVGAGLLAAPLLAVFVALAAAASDPSLWPRIRVEAWTIFLERSLLLRMLHAYLAAFATGGIALMLVGRRAFRWESGLLVSEGARIIRLGALLALCAILLQVGLVGAWLLLRGLEPVREALFEGGPRVVLSLVLAAAGAVALLEVLASTIRWRGSAPRASAAAAILLFLIVLAAGSGRFWMRGPAGCLSGPRGASPVGEGKAGGVPPKTSTR